MDTRIMKEFKGMDGVVEAITGKVVKGVAIRVNEVTNMKHSKGWLYKLQQRHGVVRKRKYGEVASVDQEAATEGRKKMQKLTDTYARSNIYNMDETSFFFQSEGKMTLTQKKVVSGARTRNFE
ncbi:DNA binding protein [Phytophthora megakarya]|uniref:DNA binding protein n=1 Tax=Phytophthora megakarya TaxID=4795 RepID=A0A225WWB0_9STRA|nr:DNA binding protein [Phytophthora megakarya]